MNKTTAVTSDSSIVIYNALRYSVDASIEDDQEIIWYLLKKCEAEPNDDCLRLARASDVEVVFKARDPVHFD